ncbi:MAG: AAA family ATPase, partial [Thermoplasmata archaeon]
NPLLEFFYLKFTDGEIDFVLKEGLEIKQLIQVTYASGRDEIERREIKSLVKAGNELKCKDLLLITWDYEDELKVDNKTIRCAPLWEWLLTV